MSYKYDITKYAGKRALNVEAIFDQLPLQLDTGTRRFVLNSIDDDARYESYRIQYSLRQLAIRKCQSKSSPWMLRRFHRFVYHHYLKIPSQCQQLFHLRKRQYSGGGLYKPGYTGCVSAPKCNNAGQRRIGYLSSERRHNKFSFLDVNSALAKSLSNNAIPKLGRREVMIV